ncbi:MAG: hypothetical protein JWM24_1012 [Solirubrobacterales bacterium]|nr:hypothetical protein [Solirubrobacterales bacterium]
MSDLPDADAFVRAAAAVEVDQNLSLEMVVAKVVARRSRCKRFSSPEELAEAVDGGDDLARELEADVMSIRGVLRGELAKAGVSVGVDALDEVLLARLQDPGVSDPLESSVARLWEVGGAGSLLVFPLHSLGITPLEPLQNPDLLLNAEWELAIGSQTNDYGQTASLLEGVCEKLGVSGPFPYGSLRGRWLARRVKWFKRNPLLLMRVASPIGTPGLDDRVLLARLRVTTAFLAMLSTLEVGNGYPALNSRVINNVQTLDIENYVLITPEHEPAPATVVPIRDWQPELVELSDLEIQLHPEVWDGSREDAGRLHARCEEFYAGYLRHGIGPEPDAVDPEYHRAFEALAYFRRSFTRRIWQRAISLALAFELLLADPGRGNTSKRIGNTLRSLPDCSKAEQKRNRDAFVKLYAARNELVHEGRQRTAYDLDVAREAFVAAFMAKAAQLAAR